MYQALCLLHGIWRYLGCSRTCKDFQAMPKDQAHKHLLSSFFQACAQRTHQNIPHQYQRPDCWHSSSSLLIPRKVPSYCDADFSGNWNKEFAPIDPSTAKSQSGLIIFYAGCPVSWASKLQSQFALTTTKAKYIDMSQSLCDIIPRMNLLQEMREQDFQVICTKPYEYCKVFKDNSGSLELARIPKLCPRTKHINIC